MKLLPGEPGDSGENECRKSYFKLENEWTGTKCGRCAAVDIGAI